MKSEKLAELLHQYFELGVAEGREGRNHDTEAGDAQRVLSEIQAEIAAQSTDAEPFTWISQHKKDPKRLWLAAPNEPEEHDWHAAFPVYIALPAPSVTEKTDFFDVEEIRETKLATITAPDNGTEKEVLAALLECAEAWVPEARIIGNVRAGDIARVVRPLLSSALDADMVTSMEDEDRTPMPAGLDPVLWKKADEVHHAMALVARDQECVKIIYAALSTDAEPVVEIVEAASPIAREVLGCDIKALVDLRTLPVGTKLYAAPPAPAVADWQPPQACDGKEQLAFEAWAVSQRYDMHEHPLHYIFMDPKTSAARLGWNAALRYVRDQFVASPAPTKEA